jgi:retron-type reverse transcriptase
MEHWEEVREQLLSGTYQPQPVLRQEIPKRDGGVREFGIPCVLDRLIQQAIQQVELEKRGHGFVRYVDDCNVYVRSWRAGERVMAALERIYARLRLRANREKSEVELAHKRSLLSYSFWYAKGGAVRCRVAPKAAARSGRACGKQPDAAADGALKPWSRN